MEIKLNRVAKAIIRRALREDLGKRGDITSRATIPADQTCEAVIIAKQPGIIAGQRIAEEVFKAIEKSVQYEIRVQDGEEVEPKTEVARITGKTVAILSGERTALNILGRCSGIASLTRQYVDAVTGTGVKISETRKTVPGLRYLDKSAVKVGGGVNHRFALYDAFLIKENHVAAAGGIAGAIEACRRFAEKHGRFRIMVEVRDREEYLEALSANPQRILLDNMGIDEIRACVEYEHAGVELEASGGITLNTIRDYADTGIDYISIGALTHSVTTLDLSLLVE